MVALLPNPGVRSVTNGSFRRFPVRYDFCTNRAINRHRTTKMAHQHARRTRRRELASNRRGMGKLYNVRRQL